MITNFSVKNFKSIKHLELDLARVNVFIGANGSGKSNILEAFAFVSALSENSSNIARNSQLINRGVRVAKPSLTASAFMGVEKNYKIEFSLSLNSETETFTASPNEPEDINSNWENLNLIDALRRIAAKNNTGEAISQALLDRQVHFQSLSNFLIYQPNTPALRGMTSKSDEIPLGIFGENLDVLIASFSKEEKATLDKYKNFVLWLDDYFIDENNTFKLNGYKLNRGRSNLYFVDKFMRKKDANNIFSAENSNEGVLHLLFYIALLISKRTPQFFAVDNIESSLNPHLCTHLMRTICQIANEEQTKQMLITTHNPAILDGLNLNDENIRLFAVSRNDKGHTVAQRIKTKPNNELKLSELWMRGILGAIDYSI